MRAQKKIRELSTAEADKVRGWDYRMWEVAQRLTSRGAKRQKDACGGHCPHARSSRHEGGAGAAQFVGGVEGGEGIPERLRLLERGGLEQLEQRVAGGRVEEHEHCVALEDPPRGETARAATVYRTSVLTTY